MGESKPASWVPTPYPDPKRNKVGCPECGLKLKTHLKYVNHYVSHHSTSTGK